MIGQNERPKFVTRPIGHFHPSPNDALGELEKKFGRKIPHAPARFDLGVRNSLAMLRENPLLYSAFTGNPKHLAIYEPDYHAIFMRTNASSLSLHHENMHAFNATTNEQFVSHKQRYVKNVHLLIAGDRPAPEEAETRLTLQAIDEGLALWFEHEMFNLYGKKIAPKSPNYHSLLYAIEQTDSSTRTNLNAHMHERLRKALEILTASEKEPNPSRRLNLLSQTTDVLEEACYYIGYFFVYEFLNHPEKVAAQISGTTSILELIASPPTRLSQLKEPRKYLS